MSAKVAVLLVSPEFLGSEFIQNDELPSLLNAEKSADLKVIWFPIKASVVDQTPIIEYQAAINPRKPLNGMRTPEQDEALVRIARMIAEAYRS